MTGNSAAVDQGCGTGALDAARALVPLCALRPDYLNWLVQQATVLYACIGDVLFARGVCDVRHLFLISGQVKLRYASGYTERVDAQNTRHALANEMPRPCEAVAASDCTLLVVDSDCLDRILSWSQISQYLLTQLCAERSLDDDIEWIKTVLESNLFLKVPPVNASAILHRMQPQSVVDGEVVLREGEIGDSCYFIKEGSARVTKLDPQTGVSVRLADIRAGRCFGEDALVYETLRNATVTMTSPGVLMRLDKSSFKLLLEEPGIEEVSEGQLQDLVDAPVYIDVRTQEEYEQGHLALAANVPLNILALKQRLLRKELTYVLYCDTGRRSRAAAHLLAKQGYNTRALAGGLVGAGMQYQLVNDSNYMLRCGRAEPG